MCVSCRDLLNEQLFCGFKIQYLSGISIDPVLDFLNGGAGAFGYITSLGDESANHPVGILVTAPLPGRIGMRIIEVGSGRTAEYRGLQRHVIKELAAVVCRDGLEHDLERLLAHRAFYAIDGPIHRSLGLVLDLADDQLPALTLNQSEQGGASWRRGQSVNLGIFYFSLELRKALILINRPHEFGDARFVPHSQSPCNPRPSRQRILSKVPGQNRFFIQPHNKEVTSLKQKTLTRRMYQL